MRFALLTTVVAAISVAISNAQDPNVGVRVLIEVDPAGENTIGGDVQAPSHQGWIRAVSMEMGLESLLSGAGDPAAPALTTPDRIRLIKRFDIASADLARAFDTQRVLARVTADFFLTSFDDPVPFRVILENATIEDYGIDLPQGDEVDIPIESLSFDYETITIQYTRYDGEGQPVDMGETEFDATYGTDDPLLDSDGDGIDNLQDRDDDNDMMPDAYELANGLNPLYDDSGADPDRDGQDNGSEALSLTDPRDGQSRFGIRSVTREVASGELTVRIPTVPNRTYTLQAADGLFGWQNIDSFTTSAQDPATTAEFQLTPPESRSHAQLRAVITAAP